MMQKLVRVRGMVKEESGKKYFDIAACSDHFEADISQGVQNNNCGGLQQKHDIYHAYCIIAYIVNRPGVAGAVLQTGS